MTNTINTNSNEYTKNALITTLITLGSIGTTLYLFSDKIKDYIYPIKDIDFSNLEESNEFHKENIDVDEIIKELEKELSDIQEIIKQEYKDSDNLETSINLDDSPNSSESSVEIYHDPEDFIYNQYIKVGYLTI